MKHSPLNARLARAALGPVAAAAVLISAAWLASARYQLTHAGTPFFFKASLAEGAIVMHWLLPSPDGSRSGFGNPGWALDRTPALKLRWLPRHQPGPRMRTVILPIWPAAVGTIVATLALSSAARRRPPGHCLRCGYDLAGLATCPECGRQSPP